MSNQNPSPRPRRRIAGERKGARPAGTDSAPAAPAASDRPTAPVATATPQAVVTAKPQPGGETPPPPSADDRGAEPGRTLRPVPLPVMLGLGLLALLLVVLATVGIGKGTGVQGFQDVEEQAAVEQAARTAPAAAERAAAAILSYGHETLDADRDAAARYMTPEYRKQYLATFDGLVTQNAEKLKAVVEAQVKASGVAHADPDRVNVLLFVDQTTTSTAHGGEPQIALNRVMFAMERVGETWLVDDITSY